MKKTSQTSPQVQAVKDESLAQFNKEMALFSGPSTNFSLTTNKDGSYTVIHNPGDYENEIFASLQFLSFDDGTFHVDEF